MGEVISALGIDPGRITGNPEVISHPLVQRFQTPLHSERNGCTDRCFDKAARLCNQRATPQIPWARAHANFQFLSSENSGD